MVILDHILILLRNYRLHVHVIFDNYLVSLVRFKNLQLESYYEAEKCKKGSLESKETISTIILL